MAMTLRKRLPRPPPSPVRNKPNRTGKVKPTVMRRSSRDSDLHSSSSSEEEEMADYEKIREQRMRENREKMEKLGIFGLSQQFKPEIVPRRAPPQRRPSVTRSFAAPYQLARKSDRLKEPDISVPKTWAPEVYTKEHEKLLGECEKPWTLYVDGYGEDGERLHDPLNGKMCHQCRPKTVGSFSICRQCKSAQGQLCGDCLYMRYGENVLEVNENVDWSCPSCREICNCSRCRRAKGWAPTVCLYEEVIEQGYKSIAHYLIKIRISKRKSKYNVAADANVNPDMTAHCDGSTDDDPDGCNSDSSEDDVLLKCLPTKRRAKLWKRSTKRPQRPSVKVRDDKEEVVILDASDEENEMPGALKAVNKENEILGAEINDVAEGEHPCETGVVCV